LFCICRFIFKIKHIKGYTIKNKRFKFTGLVSALIFGELSMSKYTYKKMLKYSTMKDYDNALKYAHRSLISDLKLYNKDDIEIATNYNNIGFFYKKLGQNIKALEYYNKALSIQSNICLSAESEEIAVSYNNIGSVYHNLCEYSKALDYYDKALKIQEGLQKQSRLDIAIIYNNMGTSYREQGNMQEALDYHKKALLIREHVLGKGSLVTAMSYHNVSTIYGSIGALYEALKYARISLRIRKIILGLEHYDTKESDFGLNLLIEKIEQAKRESKFDCFSKSMNTLA